VKVDQDSRPDLSNRYEDHGWPATGVFDGDGHEIVERQGYLPPEGTASMLNAIIYDPTPGPSVQREAEISFPANPLLSAALRANSAGTTSLVMTPSRVAGDSTRNTSTGILLSTLSISPPLATPGRKIWRARHSKRSFSSWIQPGASDRTCCAYSREISEKSWKVDKESSSEKQLVM